MGVKSSFVVDTAKLDKLLASIGKGEAARIIHDGVAYGIHQEFGYTSKSGGHVSGKPFIRPALERIRPALEKGWDQVLEKQVMTPDAFIEKIARDAEAIAKQEAPYLTGALKNSIDISKPEDFKS